MHSQQSNVLSTIKNLLEERGIDIEFTNEEETELYNEITRCICDHPLNYIQNMMNERLDISADVSRTMLDKMYHALDKDEKQILETFNEKIGFKVHYYEPEGKEEAIHQLIRIMRGKLWHDNYMDGEGYTYCDSIISFMDDYELKEFKKFMDKLEQTDSEIRHRNIEALGNIEDKHSILIYLGEYDAQNQQDFYHRIRRETKEYVTVNKSDNVADMLASIESVISQKKQEYKHVAVAGEGYWALVANLISSHQNLSAMLINPVLKDDTIEFVMTNPNDVEILLERPNDISKLELPDSWYIHYLWKREFEVLQSIDWAMARTCWDNWSTVNINERYGDFHR